jgi:hypothetical protein
MPIRQKQCAAADRRFEPQTGTAFPEISNTKKQREEAVPLATLLRFQNPLHAGIVKLARILGRWVG